MLKYATSRSSSSPLARCHQLTVSAVTSDTARKLARRGGALRHEGEHALPRVLGGVGELLELAVEEAVRGAVVDHDLVLDTRVLERALELRSTSTGMPSSAPPISARIGASSSAARCVGPGEPSRPAPGRP